jgi:signal peptidase II
MSGGGVIAGVERVASRLLVVVGLVLLVGCDHATKIAAKSALEGRAPHTLVRGVVDLEYRENTDVAFNLLRAVPERIRAPMLLAAGAVGVVALLVALLARRRALGLVSVALLLVTAGAVGNYLDRVARGYVVDFIRLPHWPVFNVADAYVSAGMALLALWGLRARRAGAAAA